MDAGMLTSWNLLHAAASGEKAARSCFVTRYRPAVEAYLRARWRRSPLIDAVDDAAQEVFLECLKPGGVLEKAAPGLGSGFRAYLYGVVRNVARSVADRRRRAAVDQASSDVLAGVPDEDAGAADEALDREWLRTLVREVVELQEAEAPFKGDAARRRIDLIRLRFLEGLSVPEIAERWKCEASRVHHIHAHARREFRECLHRVLERHHPDDPEGAGRELEETLRALA